MGVSTTPAFATGTQVIAQAIARNRAATTIAGGGDTAEAARQFGVEKEFTHVSTGGGASLKVVSGEELVVLKVLKEKETGTERPVST
jgi:phosphoglycerate kinase